MATIMVVGASRGIGLECAKQYAEQGHRVIATCRAIGKSELLKEVASQYPNVLIKQVDIDEEGQVRALAQEVEDAIDILVINAGISSQERGLAETSAVEMLRLFKTNAVGHFLVAKYFADHVARSERKQIISISSRMGSIADNNSGGAYAYRASKAGDNAIMKSLAHDLKEQGIHVMIFHPGWVRTDLTKGTGQLLPQESVERLRQIVEEARSYDSGAFVSHENKILPW